MHGLVLEGGGLRSLFSEGVFDVMLEHGITFDGMIGVSAGASIGCNFKSKQIGRALRYNTNFAHDWRYISLRSWLTTGDIVGGHYAYHVIPVEHDPFDWDTWDANPMAFYAVTTDVDSGETLYKQFGPFDYDALEWLRASSSMPIVSRPVHLEGHRMLDGGITNSIPLEYFQHLGYQKNVVILTQPRTYFKKKTKLSLLFRLCCRRYPKIAEAMERRHLMYNQQLEYVSQQEAAGNTLVISPDRPLDIGRIEMNPQKMQRVYHQGRTVGLQYIQQIKHFLEEE